ncbi:MAG: sugar transferase [Coprobacter sp.]|nr:sugar transferase [Coprobacter sp.]
MRKNKQIAKYVLGDLISTNIGWFLFNLMRFYVFFPNAGFINLKSFLCYSPVLKGQFLFPLFFIFVFYLSGYYNRPFLKSRLGEFFTTLFSVAISVLVIFFSILINDIQKLPVNSYNLLIGLFVLNFFCVYACRAFITQRATRCIHEKRWGFNTLIIGSGEKARTLYRELMQMKRSLGFLISGFVRLPEETAGQSSTLETLPVFELADLEQIIQTYNIEELIVALDSENKNAIHKTINSLYPCNLPIRLQLDEWEMLTTQVKISNIYGTPFIDICKCSLSECEKNIKRLFDIIISVIALVLLSPFFAVIALKIKLDTAGPVFYTQKRIGFRRKEFTLYKFRTMCVDAEKDGPALSKENDRRITAFGHFMRKYRIDELPQFWNVIIGDMSIVGPRPERAYYIEQIVRKAPYYSLLHQIRPGITSWGMVKFGYARNVDEMVERLKYEILYLENMSLLVDLKIIIYTIKTVITGKGI